MTTQSSLTRPRVTISEVAKAAGVSKATVSRYIGGDRQLLAEATAQRLEAVIQHLGYRPNQMARGLKRGQTRLIGMLVADILNPYSVAVIHGVETACRQHGYSLVLCNTNRDDEQERHHLQALQSYNVEGLIVNTLGHQPGELLDLHRRLPMVLVDRQLADLQVDLVGLDNTDAVEQALDHPLDHLQTQGYRDIIAIGEPLDGTSSRHERVQAFTASVQRRASVRGRVLSLDAHLPQTLEQCLANDDHGPQALLTFNGVATLAVTRALQVAGRGLGDDLGLIAIDELDWCSLVGPGITALAQPTERIGAAAFERLDFKAQLIVRGSTSLPT